MSWKDALRATSRIRINWVNSRTPPKMYYYDKLDANLKKEFDEIFDKMLEDIQMGYLNGKVQEGISGSRSTENMRGQFNLVDGVTPNERIAQFKFEIAPSNSSTDKFGRFREYYLSFDKAIDPTKPSRNTEGVWISSENWDILMENILDVKKT